MLFCSSLLSTAQGASVNDPWENWNRDVQHFNDKLDNHVIKPVANAYHWITPSYVDMGITNFFNNIDDIGVFVNDFLQFKPLKGGKDLGRFIVNSTAGLAGFFDVASHIKLNKNKEDFDQTLATWGIPSGPYMVIPFFGPSTPRGAFGLAADAASNPLNYIVPIAVPWTTGALNATDKRSDMMGLSKIADAAAHDYYAFIRNGYFQERAYQIHDGNPPADAEFEQAEKELDALNK